MRCEYYGLIFAVFRFGLCGVIFSENSTYFRRCKQFVLDTKYSASYFREGYTKDVSYKIGRYLVSYEREYHILSMTAAKVSEIYQVCKHGLSLYEDY